MTLSRSFDASEDHHAHILILGSMPGTESLKQHQYYAHPRNLFWDFIDEFFGIDCNRPYPERLQKLRSKHVALWDVAYQCERPGSLDSNIKSASIVPNDFSAFFEAHPDIQAIFFNGQKAAQIYRKLVLPSLPAKWQALPLHALPSTSPAHAAMNREDKMKQWLKVRETAATLVA
jgi:TDG/mug DNA glycosylase family protein